MTEKVNPCHPDKVADRIAGAIVDIAYAAEDDPKIAVEALVGHGVCHVIIETTARLDRSAIAAAIARIAGPVAADIVIVEQDKLLSENQSDGFRCGDNGIFKGVPLTEEQLRLSGIARSIFERYPCDGKYILDGDRLIICQSSATAEYLKDAFPGAEVNPIGDWTGGTDVDTGAVNHGHRKADSHTPCVDYFPQYCVKEPLGIHKVFRGTFSLSCEKFSSARFYGVLDEWNFT